MQLSAIAYNLKKYLKFIEKRSKSGARAMTLLGFTKKHFIKAIFRPIKPY